MVTRKAGHGDFSVRADMQDGDEELEELAEGFNQMVERIGNLVEDIQIEQLNLPDNRAKGSSRHRSIHIFFIIHWMPLSGWLRRGKKNR